MIDSSRRRHSGLIKMPAALVLATILLAGCGPKPERAPQLRDARRAQERAERRPRDFEAQLRAADLSYQHGLYNDAYRSYQRALALEPNHLAAISGMARANLKLRNPTEGLEWARRALRQTPHDPDLVALQAQLYLLAGRTNQAIAGFREALRLQPDRPATWLNLASAYAITRRYDEAISATRQATALDPKSAPAHFVLGRYLEKQGASLEAEQEYRNAMAADAQHAPARLALARLLVGEKRQLDEARSLAIQAGQLEADPAEAAILAAWVLHLQGEDRRCAEELAKIVAEHPQEVDGWAKLAVVLDKIGQPKDAQRARIMAKRFAREKPAEEVETLETD